MFFYHHGGTHNKIFPNQTLLKFSVFLLRKGSGTELFSGRDLKIGQNVKKMAQNDPKSGPNVLNRCTKLRFLGVPERLEMVLSLRWPPMHHFGGPGAPDGANLRPFGLRRVKYADPPRMVLGVPTRVQNTSRRSGTPKNLTEVVLAAR